LGQSTLSGAPPQRHLWQPAARRVKPRLGRFPPFVQPAQAGSV